MWSPSCPYNGVSQGKVLQIKMELVNIAMNIHRGIHCVLLNESSSILRTSLLILDIDISF